MQQACAVETFVAKTIFPEDEANVKKNTPLKRYPAGSNKNSAFSAIEFIPPTVEKKEFYIKNPFEKFFIKEVEASNELVQNNEEEVKEDVLIESRELEYFDETGELEARGDVVITSKDGTVITAQRALYDRNANTIKLYDDVVLNQGVNKVYGEYMFIDLNEENALMDEPVISAGPVIKILAEEGYAYADRLEAVNGDVELAKKIDVKLQTSGFSSYDNALMRDEEIPFEQKTKRIANYKIKTKEIVVVSQKDHDSIVLKNADLYYKKFKVLTLNSLELFADKDREVVDASLPIDLGSLSDFGTYFGVGHIFKLPTGSTLKVSPALVVEDGDFGIGVLGRLKSKRLDLQSAWATSNENLVIDGKYKITPRLRAEFGRHAYKSDWFIGAHRAGHIGQLVYEDSYPVADLEATFRQAFTAGYVSEYRRYRQEKDNLGTSRFRWQAELDKSLFKMSNEEQDMMLGFSVFGQTMATVYGMGQTVGLVRGGPRIISRVKNWYSSIEYALGGLHGHSPFRFDEYTYGRSAISVDESLKLNKYVSVGYRGIISPLKDNYEDDLLTENSVYAVVGPEDVKVAFSYDMKRSNAYVNLMFLLGMDKTKIEYQKITVKDPSKIGKKPAPFSENIEYMKIKVPENL